ncbi:MAG: YARHG domain-containing protein [Verrucomicrobiota bacterium]
MTKRVPPTAGETWDIWSSSLLGLYNPLAKRMPYMTGKKASSVQYKSAESFPVEIRIRLEPVQRTGSFDQREESTSDSTLAATTPQPVLQPGQAIQSGTPELAYIFPTIAPSFATPETAPAFPGERYPDTRSRVFVAGELQSWSTDQLQYAINEIFARHGGDFPDKKEVREYFGQFAWYHPHRGSSLDQIEASLPYVEQQNVKILGEVRNIKRNPLSVAAGNWYGILYWRDGTVNKQELIFASDLRQVANRASSLDAASGWNNYPVQKRGSTLTWQIAGLGRITYLTFAPDGNGQQAQVSSQIVQQGRVAYSAAGMFYRYDVPLPIPNTSSPDPQARQIFGGFLEGISQAIQNAGASGSNGSNTFRPPNKRRRGP